MRRPFTKAFFFGTRLRRPTPFVGMKLMMTPLSAAAFGPHIFRAAFDMQDLKVFDFIFDQDEIEERMQKQSWPGDTESERRILSKEGIDAITYVDVDEDGTQHDTIRIISSRAAQRVRFF